MYEPDSADMRLPALRGASLMSHYFGKTFLWPARLAHRFDHCLFSALGWEFEEKSGGAGCQGAKDKLPDLVEKTRVKKKGGKLLD